MAYEDYTIKQFEDAWFKNDRTLMNDETFDLVYTEFIDTAQLYRTDEFEKVSYIYFLNTRINKIKLCIKAQKEFVETFGVPYPENFEIFKKHGYSIKWKNSKEDFFNQLKKVELSETRYTAQIESKIKELEDIRKKKPKEEITEKQKRENWVRMINTLRKIGWVIQKESDTVQDLSVMILQQNEENKTLEK